MHVRVNAFVHAAGGEYDEYSTAEHEGLVQVLTGLISGPAKFLCAG